MQTKYKTLNKVLQNPSEISEIMKDPAKYGMDFWNELSHKEQSYIVLAAAAGLAMYGIYLGRQTELNRGDLKAIEAENNVTS